MSLVDLVWTEKYRPKTVADCIFPDSLTETFNGFLEKKSCPNLILSGTAGTGKTTVARALASELGMEVLFVNGSLEGRLIDNLRGLITDFASRESFSDSGKLILIDEFDRMPDLVQDALKAFIEQFSVNCKFIFTCNHINRIIDPIKSRTTNIEFRATPDEQKSQCVRMLKRSSAILKQEGIEFEPAALAELIMKHYPDFRRVINELHRLSSRGPITMESVKSSSKDLGVVWGLMKTREFGELRKWVGEQPYLDVDEIVTGLYKGADEWLEEASIASLVVVLSDYSFKSRSVADMEILITAMLVEIMAGTKFK